MIAESKPSSALSSPPQGTPVAGYISCHPLGSRVIRPLQQPPYLLLRSRRGFQVISRLISWAHAPCLESRHVSTLVGYCVFPSRDCPVLFMDNSAPQGTTAATYHKRHKYWADAPLIHQASSSSSITMVSLSSSSCLILVSDPVFTS